MDGKRPPRLHSKTPPTWVSHWYGGTMHAASMAPEARRALRSWNDQVTRCYRPECDSYGYYGAVGVRVKYLAREFVGWWLSEVSDFKGERPTISRLDHSGHYEFGNVKIEDHRQNCVVDVLKRHGPPALKIAKHIVMVDLTNGRVFGPYLGAVEAERYTGFPRLTIYRHCKGVQGNSPLKFTFRYWDAGSPLPECIKQT